MNKHRIAGLRGAVTVARRMVAANEQDIAHGHDFHRYLAENRLRLAAAELKLSRELCK